MAFSWATGVCVGGNRLEWTVLRRTKESWAVHARGEAELPGTKEGIGGVPGAALRPMLKPFRGKISVALPTESVLLRVALLPSADAGELRGMAELQTDKYSPFPVETMALGAETIETAENASLVAMAAVRRNLVEEIGGPFQEAGAPPDVVDVEALGWWWGVKRSALVPAHGTQIFLRVAGGGAELVVVRDGKPLMFRALPRPPGKGGEWAEWIAECTEETEYSLTSLETEWGASVAPTLHVLHEKNAELGWTAALRDALGAGGLFEHSIDELPTASEGVARRLTEPAQPMAMDLAPGEWRDADAVRVQRRRLLAGTTVFLTAWLLGIGLFWTLLNVQRGSLHRLGQAVDAIEPEALAVRRLQAKTLELAQYANRTHSALESMRVVSEALPAGVELTSFVYRKGSTLALRGEASAPDKVYAFIQALEQTKLYPEVKSEGVSTRNTPQGARSQFGATVRLPGNEEGGTP